MSGDILKAILQPDQAVHAVDDDIWSAGPVGKSRQVYDGNARLYDRLIGSRIYNRLAWGSSPDSYAAFADRAIRSGSGVLLDAGCGSLVSTARLHVGSGRPTILCDLSEGMLAAAKARLVALAGKAPDHLVLFQADLRSLPFAPASFGSILCPGMLHLFDDIEAVTRELARVAKPEARLFMSSLVADRWIGRTYLNLLHRAGEVSEPRTSRDLEDRLNEPGSGLLAPVETTREGSMAFIVAKPGSAPG